MTLIHVGNANRKGKKMKKKICMLVLALCMTAAVTGCSSDKDDTKQEDTNKKEDSSAAADLGLAKDTRIVSVSADEMGKYITMGDYKGIDVKLEIEEVTDDQIQSTIDNTLNSNAVESTDDQAEVKEGDIVNIDFVGKKDGEAFDGGTGEDYDLTIGSGSFIEGFEEGLIGAKKGDMKELALTFPESYPSEDLAGQDVIFEVTVNYIKTLPELTDEWVKENTEYDTVDAYKEGVRAELESSNESAAQSTATNTAWNQVLDASEIKEFPQEDIDKAIAEYERSLQSYADQQEMTTDEFLEAQGMTKEDFDKQAQEYAEYKVKQLLAAQAVMDAEELTLADDEIQTVINEMVTNFGVDDISALTDQYGKDSVIESVALTRINEFVLDNANVTSAISTEDGKDGYDVDAAESEPAEEDAAE